MSAARRPAALVLAALLPAAAAAAPWHLTGTNTARAEYYDAQGDRTASPFPFLEWQYYDEASLFASSRDSAWSRWSAQAVGVLFNQSDYRAGDRGLVPERLALLREDGRGALPFRAELGDFFAFTSYRTLQRSLKGLTLELQPRSTVRGRRHSLLLVSGMDQPSWLDIDALDDYYNGLSWVTSDPRLGTFGLNAVHNHRDAQPGGSGARDQGTFSLFAEHRFALPGHSLLAEAEVARLVGDTALAQGRGGGAWLLQLTGSAPAGWGYRLRYEDNQRHFRPAGAVVTPDRRAVELHGRYRWAAGLAARARLQYFRDGKGGPDPLDTWVAGVTLTGVLAPWWDRRLAGSVDLYRQTLHNDSDSVDQMSDTLRIDLARPLTAGWVARGGAFLQSIDDRRPAGNQGVRADVRLGADRTWRWRDIAFTASPSLVYRRDTTDSGDSNELRPALRVSAERGPHALFVDLGVSDRNLFVAGSADVDSADASFQYRFRRGRDLLGVEGDVFIRDPSPGASTESWRLGAFWSHSFDITLPRPQVAAARAVGIRTSSGLFVTDLPPGLALAEADRRLEAAGIRGAATIGPLRVYEVRLVPELVQRQRLVVEADAGTVRRAALIVDFDTLGEPESMQQVFERLRQWLIERFGPPETFIERGEFGPGIAQALASGRFVRVMQWRVDGGVLRFGIPERLDRTVRMEVQFARSLPDVTDRRWSLELVR